MKGGLSETSKAEELERELKRVGGEVGRGGRGVERDQSMIKDRGMSKGSWSGKTGECMVGRGGGGDERERAEAEGCSRWREAEVEVAAVVDDY